MPSKRKAGRKAGPQCAICAGPMRLKAIIPGAHIFPELKTFQCGGCGNLRTVEHEAELAPPQPASAAA
jgi:hypothetical protein